MNLFDFADEEARRQGVDPNLVRSVMRQESGGRASAVSPKGARGPMQLMPGTARDLGVNPDDPLDNIRGGVRYLKQQLDTFGSPHLALAAYNAGPGAVKRAGGVPNYPETQNYVGSIMGRSQPRSGADIFGLDDGQEGAQAGSGADIFADGPSAPPVVIAPPAPAPVAAPPQVRKDQVLGFQKGAVKPWDNAAMGLEWLVDKATGSTQPGRFSHMLGQPSAQEAAQAHAGYVDAQRQKGVVPGKLGEFAGNVVGTLPVGLLPGGVLAQGAASGAALSDAKDAPGLARDAAFGAVAGKVADKALKGLGGLATGALGKAPKVMTIPELETAKRAAYKAVDDSGFSFPKEDVTALASDFSKTVGGSALSKSAKDDALSIIHYTRSLAKGDLSLSQLEKLRGDIYEAMVKKGGDTAKVGGEFRAKIDTLIESVDNGLVRNARELNARWAKANAVTKRLDSADLAKRRAYTGANGDNTIRQKMSPLIDPMHSARLRNATADEAKALDRVVTGGPLQNLARTVGALSDPRRGIPGASLLTSVMGAPHTGGLSLGLMPVGMAATAGANRLSQKNVEALLKLIAAGGSKQALKKAPTAASRAAQAVAAKARLGSGLIGAGAAAQLGGL